MWMTDWEYHCLCGADLMRWLFKKELKESKRLKEEKLFQKIVDNDLENLYKELAAFECINNSVERPLG